MAKKLTEVRIGPRALSDEEIAELADAGRLRTEPRVLRCQVCGFTEEFEALFVKGADGETEEVPAVRAVIQDYHRRTKHPGLRSVTFRVRRPD